MPRKKTKPPTEAVAEQSSSATAVAETPAPIDEPVERPTWIDGPATEAPEPPAPPTDGTGKNYGPPYKAIYTSPEKGFELGENRRFKQRVCNDGPPRPRGLGDGHYKAAAGRVNLPRPLSA